MTPFELETPLYRCETSGERATLPRLPAETRRPPGYISYLVDNLWEWKRPESFPGRRYAVFANPDPNAIQVDGTCLEVHLFGNCKVAQIRETDARYHQDCKNLPKLMLKCLGKKWPSQSLAQKALAGALYIPCLGNEEVEELFRSPDLMEHRRTIWNAITFWQTAELILPGQSLPHKQGEVFFEAEQWQLTPSPYSTDRIA